jgi:hypothetical protein
MPFFNVFLNVNIYCDGITGLAQKQAAERCVWLPLRALVLRQLLLEISAKQAVATEGQCNDE